MATNEAGARITVSGTGAHGIRASIYDSSSAVANGTAQAINRGMVISSANANYPTDTSVSSHRSEAVHAFAESGMAIAQNTGQVTTTGLGARGVYAFVDAPGPNNAASVASARNEGMIETQGNQAAGASLLSTRGAYGLAAGVDANGGMATATNARTDNSTGTVMTRGARAFGVFAFADEVDQTGATIMALNQGNVTTTEENEGTPQLSSLGGAHGVLPLFLQRVVANQLPIPLTRAMQRALW